MSAPQIDDRKKRGRLGWGAQGDHIRQGNLYVLATCRFEVVRGWRVCLTCGRKVEHIASGTRPVTQQTSTLVR